MTAVKWVVDLSDVNVKQATVVSAVESKFMRKKSKICLNVQKYILKH